MFEKTFYRIAGQALSLDGTLREDSAIVIKGIYPVQTEKSPTGFCQRAIHKAGFKEAKCNGWKSTFVVAAGNRVERSLDDLRREYARREKARREYARRQMSGWADAAAGSAFWAAVDQSKGTESGGSSSSAAAAPGNQAEDVCSQESVIDASSSQGSENNTCD